MNGRASTRLFVYGTLRPVHRNKYALMLARTGTYLGRARISGRLYRIGHFPGLKLEHSGESWATGDVFGLRDARRTLRVLDEYEGSDFKRTTAPVLLDSGEWIDAQVYIYCRSVAGKRRQ